MATTEEMAEALRRQEEEAKAKAGAGNIGPLAVKKSDSGAGDVLGGTQTGFERHIGGAIGGAAGNPFAVREGQRATEGTGGDPTKIAENLNRSVNKNAKTVEGALGRAGEYIFGGKGDKIKEVEDPTIGFQDKVAQVMGKYPSQQAQAQQVQGPGGLQAAQSGLADAIRAQQIQGSSYDPTLAGRTQVGQASTYGGAQIDTAAQQQFRDAQGNLLSAVQQGPSTAQLAGQQLQEDAIARAMSQAASARGGNIALAQRGAQQALMTETQKIGAQTQAAVAQEGLQRQQLAAQIAQQARAGDIDLATQQAQLASQAGLQAAELGTKVTLSQAEMDQARELANAALATDASKFTAQTSFEAAKANQSAGLQADIQNTLNQIDVSKFNANAQNQMEQFKADAQLRADIANQAADLQAQGMNMEQAAKQLGIEMDAMKALLGASTAVFQTKQGVAVEQGKLSQAKKSGIIDGIATGVASFFS